MRCTDTKKILFSYPYNCEYEDYIKKELKKQIAFELIDKLPFEEFSKQTPFGIEYTVSLDVAIEQWDEFSRKIFLQFSDKN